MSANDFIKFHAGMNPFPSPVLLALKCRFRPRDQKKRRLWEREWYESKIAGVLYFRFDSPVI